MTQLLTSNIWLALFTRSTEVKEAPPPLQKEATQFSSKWNKCRWGIWGEYFVQGGFFNWSALKMTKCQITCKSLQKSSKCQNFLRVWHLVIFRADQLKKPPCMCITLVNWSIFKVIVMETDQAQSSEQAFNSLFNTPSSSIHSAAAVSLNPSTATPQRRSNLPDGQG